MGYYDALSAYGIDDEWWDDYDKANEPDCMGAYHRAFEEAD